MYATFFFFFFFEVSNRIQLFFVNLGNTLSIVFSFCQLITFYIKKTLLSTNKLGTRYFMAVFFLLIYHAFIINKKKGNLWFRKKMYLISRQLWDGAVAFGLGSWEWLPFIQTPAFRWLAWYLKGEKAGRLEHSQHV